MGGSCSSDLCHLLGRHLPFALAQIQIPRRPHSKLRGQQGILDVCVRTDLDKHPRLALSNSHSSQQCAAAPATGSGCRISDSPMRKASIPGRAQPLPYRPLCGCRSRPPSPRSAGKHLRQFAGAVQRHLKRASGHGCSRRRTRSPAPLRAVQFRRDHAPRTAHRVAAMRASFEPQRLSARHRFSAATISKNRIRPVGPRLQHLKLIHHKVLAQARNRSPPRTRSRRRFSSDP